jgi:hypothetical protein
MRLTCLPLVAAPDEHPDHQVHHSGEALTGEKNKRRRNGEIGFILRMRCDRLCTFLSKEAGSNLSPLGDFPRQITYSYGERADEVASFQKSQAVAAFN